MLRQLAAHKRQWAITIFFTTALLALNATQSYRAIRELIANEARASTTKSVLRSIKDLYSSMQDAELGLRGYLLSGDDDYLAPYFQSLESIQQHLLELKSYDYQLKDQLTRVDEVESLIVKRLEEMNHHIQGKAQGIDSAWLSSLKMKDSHDSVNDLHALIRQMESLEYELLNQQSKIARKSRNSVMWTLVVSNVVGLLLIGFIASLIMRAMNRQFKEAEILENMVKQRTMELQHYSNELQRSNRELQDFAFVASHDLQEPLRKIRAFGDRLKTRYGPQLGEGEDYINRMQKASERMSNLIEDLLKFSRVSTSSNELQDVDLNTVIEEVLDALEVKIEETGATLQIDALPTISGDASQLRQLFQNLIGNALKFVQPGKVPDIKVRSSEYILDTDQDFLAQSFYRIEIHDNGIGFDEKYLEKIFTPFQRLHGKDRYEGTGIGLAICRRIVERHQGRISASSVAGEGTTFTVDFLKTPTLASNNEKESDDEQKANRYING